MGARLRRVGSGISRRRLFETAAVAAASAPAAADTAPAGPEVYTRLGVRPFINCTATYTINGGSLMLPEVVEAIRQAANYHVNLDELMEKAGDRLAKLLQVEWAFVTSGAAAALTHATAGVIAGTDPEKIQRLPDLTGLKNEVIMPRESRVAYDQAIRAVGVRIVEVDSTAELQAAIGRNTAMVAVLGNHFGSARLDLKDVAPIARKAGIPVLVDAAADYLIVPNPYLALGADLVAYSGGKILRGPQTAGLLLGRRELVRAAWANSSPHHAIGRALKVSKEEIAGMVRAVEVWRTERDIQADFKEWERWYAYITEQITKVPGVQGTVRGPIRGGPFPTLNVSWDPARVGLTAGQVGRLLLDGEPRIMSHAEGDGHAFLIRPVAMKPDEYKIVAQRLYDIFRSAPKALAVKSSPGAPVADISGNWETEIQYERGSARHKLFLAARDNQVTGSHSGWAFQGEIRGSVDGDRVELRSSLAADGTRLSYLFKGTISGDAMTGTVSLGEYGTARWHAQRKA